MANEPNIIFNQRAADKLRSSDDLDKYVRITSPSKWAIVVALALLLAGLLAWVVFGTVSTKVTTSGACVGNRAMCFLSAEDAAKVSVGDTSNVGGKQLSVDEVASVPLSRDEARALLGNDYLASTLIPGDWAYLVVFEGGTDGLAQNVPLTVDITTERMAPIALLLG